jgi:hypothetical protein
MAFLLIFAEEKPFPSPELPNQFHVIDRLHPHPYMQRRAPSSSATKARAFLALRSVVNPLINPEWSEMHG